MNSTWYTQFEQEMKTSQKQYQKHTNQKKVLIPCVVGGMFLVFILMAVFNNPNIDNSQLMPFVYLAIGMAVLIILCFLLAKKKGSKDWTKGVRENLESILTTPELVTLFDREMAVAPLFNLTLDSSNSVMFTEHFIFRKVTTVESTDYRFAKLSDIAANNFAITEGAQKFSKLYLVDLLDASNKKVLGLSVPGREKMDELEAALTRFCPGIR